MEKFYSSGLRFECAKCGKCCRIADGVVYFSEFDAERMAKHLKISRDSFIKKFTHKEFKMRVLNSFPNGDCVFWVEDRGCIIYDSRPEQCRSFPFWKSNLISQRTWDMSAQDCPGMNRGRLFSIEEIESVLFGNTDDYD
jgi:uncharacterized protein